MPKNRGFVGLIRKCFSNSMVVSNLEVNGLNAILASQELEMMADTMQAGPSILHLLPMLMISYVICAL